MNCHVDSLIFLLMVSNTTWCHILEGSSLYSLHAEEINSHIIMFIFILFLPSVMFWFFLLALCMYFMFLYLSSLYGSGFLKSIFLTFCRHCELQLLIFKGEIVSHVLVIVYFINISQFPFRTSWYFTYHFSWQFWILFVPRIATENREMNSISRPIHLSGTWFQY